MSSSNEDGMKPLPTAIIVDTTKTNGEDDAVGLNGLEDEFQKVVSIVAEDSVQSNSTNDDKRSTEPPTSAAVSNSTVGIKISEKVLKQDEIVDIKISKSLRRIASLIDDAKNILILSGAGVSVAAGIPDFRTPGTGLYDNLQKYNLPYAEAVFDIQYYQFNPKPFVQLAADLWPDHHIPTITHSFIALLADKQRLLRNYTQVSFSF
jgi:hypothetical protein